LTEKTTTFMLDIIFLQKRDHHSCKIEKH